MKKFIFLIFSLFMYTTSCDIDRKPNVYEFKTDFTDYSVRENHTIYFTYADGNNYSIPYQLPNKEKELELLSTKNNQMNMTSFMGKRTHMIVDYSGQLWVIPCFNTSYTQVLVDADHIKFFYEDIKDQSVEEYLVKIVSRKEYSDILAHNPYIYYKDNINKVYDILIDTNSCEFIATMK